MKDLWIGRAAALLTGGFLATVLPEMVRYWVLGFMVLIGVRLLLWRPRDFFGRIFRPEILLLGASILVGFAYSAIAERDLPSPLMLDRVEVVGRLTDWNMMTDQAVGTLRIEEVNGALLTDVDQKGTMVQEQWSGQTYRLNVYADKNGQFVGMWPRIQPGDQIRFQARLEKPKAVGTPGGFDLRLYDYVRGLSGTLFARGDVELISVGSPSLTWKIRQHVRQRLEVWDPSETGVLEGIFFGDSSRIPDVIQERYRVTGVLHVFAASGSNVAFVLGLAWLFLRFLPKTPRILGTAGALMLYAALCGGNAPIMRATILGIAVLFGRFGRGRVANLRWLLFAACGLLLQNPLILQDTGFQLSFAATWGIMVLTPRLLKERGVKRLPPMLRFAVAGTLAAQIATLPILISAFHRLSLIGFFANIFILFILGSVLEIGLLGVILSFSVGLSAPFFQVSLWLLHWTNLLLKVLAELPYADVWVLNPGLPFWVAWYGGIGIMLWGRQRAMFIAKVKLRPLRQKLIPVFEVFAKRWPFAMPNGSQCLKRSLSGRWIPLILLMLLLWSPWTNFRELEVVMLDVGQGDSLLIRTPKQQAILIDTGPRSERFDAGERIILPYLLQTGIRHLDALLITHEHQDHVGGAQAVLQAIPTDWVGVPDVGDRLQNAEWQAGLPYQLSAGGEGVRTLRAGDRINLDSGAWLDVLGPVQVLSGTHSDANNNSLVLKLHYLGQSVLFTADMEEEEMEDIAGTGVSLETNIFKEPHHGSRFSLDRPVLDAIHPQAVLISVGKNTFGHPAPEVLQYWAGRHIPVYRTDESGTLRIRIGNRGFDILSGR